MRFRKKPVEIEAVQFTGSNADKLMEFTQEGPHVRIRTTNENADGTCELYIETLEGNMLAQAGDWIIKGVKGEFYPCKPDIFEATYEGVTE
jgi:hypothetical protein